MDLRRVTEISKVFIEEGLGWGPQSEAEGLGSGESAAAEPSADVQRAAKLRRALERLGPTFVKFGQLLATRVDLFSEGFLQELGKLRSHVPPFPAAEARRIVEQETGRPLEDVFSVFPEEPVASASIAQVYKAQLRATGEWVAVKVQRPKLAQTITSDLAVLMEVSRFVDRLVPAYHRSMVHRVAMEYAARARQEISFLAEANAMVRFQDVLGSLPEFRAPRVHLDLSTERLLVMEWFEGPLLDEIGGPTQLRDMGLDPKSFASAMLRLQLVMSYEHGFVHGDTHAGNIIMLPDGKIGLIDFGLHGDVPRQLCDRMLELLFYQSWGRTDEAVKAFLRIFSPNAKLDSSAFEEELRRILSTTNTAPAGESRITDQLVEGLRLGARYQLQAQSELFVVIRNLAIVEGIVLAYCPDLDLAHEARETLGGILQRRAFGTFARGDLEPIIPLALLTLSQRPQLMDRVMRLARSFADSSNLGEFLKHEGVFDHQKPVERSPIALSLLLAGLAGAATAGLTYWLLVQ